MLSIDSIPAAYDLQEAISPWETSYSRLSTALGPYPDKKSRWNDSGFWSSPASSPTSTQTTPAFDSVNDIMTPSDDTLFSGEEHSDPDDSDEKMNTFSRRNRRQSFKPKSIRYPHDVDTPFDDLLMSHLEVILERLAMEHEQDAFLTHNKKKADEKMNTQCISLPLPPDYSERFLFEDDDPLEDKPIFRRSWIETPEQVVRSMKALKRRSMMAMIDREFKLMPLETPEPGSKFVEKSSLLLVVPPAAVRLQWTHRLEQQFNRRKAWKWWLGSSFSVPAEIESDVSSKAAAQSIRKTPFLAPHTFFRKGLGKARDKPRSRP